MLKSMTGYGKSICEINSKNITIEIKTLNSKQLDISTRIPSFYKEKEIEVRNLISQTIERGKIDFAIYVDLSAENQSAMFNKPIIKNYYTQLHEIKSELNINDTDYLQLILNLPDILKTEREILDENEWKHIKKYILIAIDETNNFRKQEGKALQNDLENRISKIRKLLNELEKPEKTRIQKIKDRIKNNLNEFFDIDQIDQNRFEQEIIYYIEKLDITEEKVRLNNHCEYFIKTIKSVQSTGKKLGFISQEIGREINTIGSKANDSDMQLIVIQMKDELEKIKEQVLNIL